MSKKANAEPEPGGKALPYVVEAGIPKAEAVVYLDPRGVVVKLHGLGAELQGLDPANALEALQYAEELLWNMRQLIGASLAVWAGEEVHDGDADD